MTKEYSFSLIGCKIDLSHLVSLLEKIGMSLEKDELSISFSDSTSIKELDINELSTMDFANKEIKSIKANYRKLIFDDKINIESKTYFTFEQDIFDECYKITISSSDFDVFSKLKLIIDEWINNVRISYRIRLYGLFNHPVFLCVLSSILLTGATIVGIFCHINITAYFSAFILLVFVFLFVYSSFVSFLFSFLEKSFPKTEIDIGMNKATKRRKIACWLLTSLILPFIFMIIGIVLK